MSILAPGPVHYVPKYSCVHCRNAVCSNSRTISCARCANWVAYMSRILQLNWTIMKPTSTLERNLLSSSDKCLWSTFLFSLCSISTSRWRVLHVLIWTQWGPFCGSFYFLIFETQGKHFLHLNFRSLIPHLEELKLITYVCIVALKGISETWLDDSAFDNEVLIPDYAILRCDRNRNGDGAYMLYTLWYSILDWIFMRMELKWYRLTDQ